LIANVVSGCEREARVFDPEPPTGGGTRSRYQVTLKWHNGRPVARVTNWYEQNAYALSRGQQLYRDFNCISCHARGGGGTGPAFLDSKWRYGSDPPEVYGSIMYGRPNGMPSFRGKIGEAEAWELAAYVRSLGGLTGKSAAPGRTDERKGPPP